MERAENRVVAGSWSGRFVSGLTEEEWVFMVKGFACTGTGVVGTTRPSADGGSGSNVTVTPLARWRRHVRWAVGAAVVLAGLVLSACGGGTADQHRSTRSLTVAFPFQVNSLDYLTLNGAASGGIVALTSDQLVFAGGPCKLTPQLATSISYPDPKTIVFHLRRGVRFSNGDPLTAEDVAWTIGRVYGAGSLFQIEFPNYKSVSVTGPHEVTVRLTKPTPVVACITSAPILVQDKRYALQHRKDYGTSAAPPIGTGPYKVAKFDSDGVTLVRNPYYWGPKPAMQRIRFVYIADDNTAQLAMRSGQIQADWMVGNPQTLGAWKAIPGANVVAVQGASSTLISMDVTRAPFNDIHVRKAVAYAVDRKGLANSVAPGYATPLKGLVTADGFDSVAPSDAAAEQLLDSLPRYDFDLAKAKAELAQSAYPHGFTVRLPYLSTSSPAELTALSLKQNLQSIGIKVQLKPLASAQYYTSAVLYAAHPGMQVTTGYTSYLEDPNAGLANIVGKINAPAEKANGATGGGNVANFYSADVDRAWDQMYNSVDTAVRWKGTQATLRAIANQVPYIPVMNLPQLVVLGDGLSFNGPVSVLDMTNNQWIAKLR